VVEKEKKVRGYIKILHIFFLRNSNKFHINNRKLYIKKIDAFDYKICMVFALRLNID